ncbi:hypothetical protein [Parvicella tangerina]|uniref:Uncharacterized protein n=1 Tax=Parvicella tangerina TaxID=2829795 RepID=A0A916JL61_9FLAO|nr:hypothetical protein [Parvicella tangerina]CAG5080416.1 hypothetical protein CRYO30217_01301 [Parvicella tangerina]
MEKVQTQPTPTTKSKKKVSRKTLEELERQTIVHCKHTLNAGDGIRIWRTTFLVEQPSGKKRKLIHAENISMHPTWTIMDRSGEYRFTLYFEGLSKDCKTFDLIEEIPQPGAFSVHNIPRNNQDVYRVKLA